VGEDAHAATVRRTAVAAAGHGTMRVMTLAAPPPPPLPPPAIERPAPRQASYGLVTGVAPAGARRIVVRAAGRTLADRTLGGRRFSLRVTLPRGESRVRVVVFARDGRRSTAAVGPVRGLPPAARPRPTAERFDAALTRSARRLAAAYAGSSGVYVQSLTSGAGAAWNARARFPAASTLKLAIAVAVLARHEGVPAAGSNVDQLLHRMLVHSDNVSANALEVWLGGSTSGGSGIVNALLAAAGIHDTEMYGGYEIERATSGRIPVRVDDQPSWGLGKYTTARDLALLLRGVWLASAGKGPLVRQGLDAAAARYLLFVLGRVDDRGKLDRGVAGLPGVTVLHKAGWIDTARHDAGLVFWRGGVYVAAVLTWRSRGAGLDADRLAGRVARAALHRFGA
jgi:beta-lactamase class A